MSDGFPNKPRILRGAFVEYGLSLPPLVVVFQFNPLQLARSRGLTFAVPNPPTAASPASQRSLREFHGRYSSLSELQRDQIVTVDEQTIDFELRLDATDRLDDRDAVTERFGVAPQLATLELMVQPKDESLTGALFRRTGGFSFTRGANPPMVLFVFGRKRVLPVNIATMTITETEFSAELNPVRATVAVSLSVIEGRSVPYLYSRAAVEALSAVALADVADAANVVVPG